MSGVERRPSRKASVSERTTLNRDVAKLLQGLVAQGAPLKYRKNWGGFVATAGEPDWTGCAAGRYWAIETKDPKFDDLRGRTPSPAQAVVLREIQRAGGATLVTNQLGVIEQFFKWLLNQPSARIVSEFYPTKPAR